MMTTEKAEKMLSGILDANQELKADSMIVRKASRRESHLVMTLTEGKNREIRRLCISVVHEVTKLKRVAYGNLTLGNMSPGEHRILNSDEIITAFPGAQQA
jgi:pseudouridine synthase